MVDPFYAPPANNPSSMAAAARRDVWWTVAAVGIGLLLLAAIIAFFDDSTHRAAEFFALFGYVTLVVGLTLAAVLGAAYHWGARVALLLGAAFLAVRSFPVGFL